jgi:hypothetical protein
VSAVGAVRRPLAVAETGARLAAYVHVLREAVHVSCARLAPEPQLEVKLLLADHVYDDARTVSKLRRRLADLGREHRGGPGPALAALLDRAAVYDALKPALTAAVREHLERVDPVADEPSLRLLTQLLHRQERHLVELGPTPLDPPPLPHDTGAERTLAIGPLVAEPARDGFITVVADHRPQGTEQVLHALMNAELCGAELAAQTSHEYPEMPWDFHVDMARQAADCARHVAALDRLLTERGGHWGDHPVSLAGFRDRHARDLAGRLAPADRPRPTDDPLFQYLEADWAAQARANERWR